MKYIIPQEIKSETKITKNIYLFDFFFLLVYVSFTALTANIVSGTLTVLYWFFSIACALMLISSSRRNRKRRFYQSLVIYLSRDKKIYRPIANLSMRTDAAKEAKKGGMA